MKGKEKVLPPFVQQILDAQAQRQAQSLRQQAPVMAGGYGAPVASMPNRESSRTTLPVLPVLVPASAPTLNNKFRPVPKPAPAPIPAPIPALPDVSARDPLLKLGWQLQPASKFNTASTYTSRTGPTMMTSLPESTQDYNANETYSQILSPPPPPSERRSTSSTSTSTSRSNSSTNSNDSSRITMTWDDESRMSLRSYETDNGWRTSNRQDMTPYYGQGSYQCTQSSDDLKFVDSVNEIDESNDTAYANFDIYLIC